MMTRTTLLLPLALLLLAVAGACDRTPDHVVRHRQMVDLLVDIHKAEGVVELNRRVYGTDSMRKLMKQSVLARHGVSQEEFDTSMVWYGQHIEKYIEVYNDVVARLEGEIAEVDADQGGARLDMAVVGDSADAWPEERLHRFFYGQPDAMVRFNLRRDENWEKGDVYTWRFFVHAGHTPLRYALAVQYTDGTTDYRQGATASRGWSEVALALDSSRTAQHVFGYASIVPDANEVPYLDSISLVRTRLYPERYAAGREPVQNYSPGR